MDFIEEQVKLYPGEVNIVCLGPCTNLALTLLKFPQLPTLVHNIFVIGGTHLGQGNTIYFNSDFNALNDPHAFHLVFDSFKSIIMIPFDAVFSMQPCGKDYLEIFRNNSDIGRNLI
jgi:purine nucleosidase